MKPDNPKGYYQYTLSINGVAKRFKAHKLVTLLFLPPPINNNMIINHKDGNKHNNHYTNLEWCTYKYNNYHARINKLNNISKNNSIRWQNDDFRKKVSKNISKGLLRAKCTQGEKNGRFRYRIFDSNGAIYSRVELKNKLNLSQSFTDKLIKDWANGITNPHFVINKIQVEDIKQSASTIEND